MIVFAWRDYLDLAERLATDHATEADLRSAISRAYYAAYHAAAGFVRTRGLLTTTHTHEKVWRTLTNDPDPYLARIGIRGNQLRQARTKADYRNPFKGDPLFEARSALIASRTIVDAMARWP